MKTKINRRHQLTTLKCILLWALLPASLASAQTIPNLCGTGRSPGCGPLQTIGLADGQWRLATPHPTDPASFSVPSTLVYGPAFVQTPNPAWLVNGPLTQWIRPQTSRAVGLYVYETNFDIPIGFDPATATISGWWSSDNDGVSVWLNDTQLFPFPLPTQTGFNTMTNFTITNGVAGATFQCSNRLFFLIMNRSADTGLRVQFNQSSVQPLPAPTLGNYPATTIPLSGNTTIAPNAAPTNTTRISVSTSTNFKGLLEGDPATGVVRVTDAHPAGTYTVTVTALNGCTPTIKTFTLTVTTPLACGSFDYNRTNIPTCANPRFVAIGDFNSDGIQDLALTCAGNPASNPGTVRVLLGKGKVNGGFGDPNPSGFIVGTNPQWIAVGDFNGDGRHDIATANAGSNDVTVLINRTIPAAQTFDFVAMPRIFVGTTPRSLATGYFDADRTQDLAVVNAVSGTVSILRGTGTGTFNGLSTFNVGGNPFAVAVGNFDNTTTQDLAVTREAGATDDVSIFLGAGTGLFTAVTPVSTVGNHPLSVAVGNFNALGVQDLATANEEDSVSILLGNGGSAGTFGSALSLPAFAPFLLPQSVAIGDFDNSAGLDDLVVASRLPSGADGIVSVVLNRGNSAFDPVFDPRQDFSVGKSPSAVAVGDFNGDGRQDIAVSNSVSNNASVLLRKPCPCAPIFSENFDGVTLPLLPPGWTANPLGSWVTSNQSPDTAVGFNNAFVDDPVGPSDKYLETSIAIPFVFGSSQLSFRQLYNLESTFDGGVLEISQPNVNNGAFRDIIIAGGSFVTGDYNATINNGYGSAIAGRRAWSGNSCCYICTVVNLPPGVIGQTIKLRWRMASDNSIAGTGWRIDKVQVSNGTGSTCCSTGPATTILGSVSTRALVAPGDSAGIGGFIIMGNDPKPVLLRAIGPSLTQFGVPNALGDPVLELHGPDPFATITNNNWRDTQEAEIQATGIPPTNDLESAIVATLDPGAYSAVISGNGNTSGIALVEIYDLDLKASSTLANISTRASVGTGDNLMIAGFIVLNGDFDRIVIRGIGPSLTDFGVAGALTNPTLELRDPNGALLVANNDWQDDAAQAAELTAAGLAPTNNLESGIFATLPPGLYTALLAGLNNGTGVGLVEVYDLDAVESTTNPPTACISP